MKSNATKFFLMLAALMASFVLPSTGFAEDRGITTIGSFDAKCDAKVRSACIEAAESHLRSSNLSMATVMLKKACFLKDKASCIKLAEISLESNHMGIAREALEEGCRFASKWACDELYRLDRSNKKFDKDDAGKAMLVWSLACTKGSPSGCRKQAEAEVILGQKDAARASYLRGCSLGDKPSCAQITHIPAH